MNQQEPYSPIHGGHGTPGPTLNPSHILRNGQDVMLPTTTASEYSYTVADQRQSQSNIDLAPTSAVGWHNVYHETADNISNDNQVSSFNLPAVFEAQSLMTPTSMNGSPALSSRTTPMFCSRDLKEEQLSPPLGSPYSFDGEDVEFDSRHNQPMKHKRPSNLTQVNTNDSAFPSTYMPPDPYYGGFGVSGVSTTSRSTATPSGLAYSPRINNVGSFSNSSYTSHVQTPPQSATGSVAFRSLDGIPHLPDMGFTSKLPIHSRRVSSTSPVMDRGRIKKSPPKSRGRQSKRSASTSIVGLVIPPDLIFEERLLLDLKRDGHEWKAIVNMYEERTQQSVSVACLQMRHKRLRDRIKEHPVNVETSYANLEPRTSNVKSSSPRNWVQNYSSVPNSSIDRERYQVIERTPRQTWSDFDNGRLQNSVSMDDLRNRGQLAPTPPYMLPNQQREHEQPYAVQADNNDYHQRRQW